MATDHPVTDSLYASFHSYLNQHGKVPEKLFLGKEDVEKYFEEILALSKRRDGYSWVFDRPMFKGVIIHEIESGKVADWAGWVPSA